MFGQKNKDQDPDLQLFTVFDSKSKSYEDPMFAPNKDVLLRDILNIFRNPDASRKNKFFVNAEDYSIFKIGDYSKRSGLVQAGNLEHIANMHDLRALATPSVADSDRRDLV